MHSDQKIGSFRYPSLKVYTVETKKFFLYAKDLITNMAVCITILHRNDIHMYSNTRLRHIIFISKECEVKRKINHYSQA